MFLGLKALVLIPTRRVDDGATRLRVIVNGIAPGCAQSLSGSARTFRVTARLELKVVHVEGTLRLHISAVVLEVIYLSLVVAEKVQRRIRVRPCTDSCILLLMMTAMIDRLLNLSHRDNSLP